MSNSQQSSDADSPDPPETWWQRRGWREWPAVRIALALLAAMGAAWWFLFAPVEVTRHTVTTGTVNATVMGTGTLEARTSTIVGPKISGLITHITVDQGDRVKAGDLLIQLEDRDIEQQVAMADAEVAAAAAALDRLRADQRRAKAVQAQASLSHKRITKLTSKNVASRQDSDQAVEALSIAEAEISIAAAALVEGEKHLSVAERSLEYQRARLHDTTIEAPFDGLVVRRDRESGDVVAPGASVLQIVSVEEMWITAWVDETELARLKDDQHARVIFRSEPGIEYEGTVARVGNEVDRETREIVVDVRVKKMPLNWAVGQRAEVYIHTDSKENVAVLPAGLELMRDGTVGVMVDDGGKARWQPITVGLRGRETIEVASGLSSRDVVVGPVDPRGTSLRDGQRISAR